MSLLIENTLAISLFIGFSISVVILAILAYCWFRLLVNDPKDRYFLQIAPGIMTSFGILGTFTGVLITLIILRYSYVSIESQLEFRNKLVEGIMPAFITSIVGLSCAIYYKYVYSRFINVKRNNDIVVLLQTLNEEVEKITSNEKLHHLMENFYDFEQLYLNAISVDKFITRLSNSYESILIIPKLETAIIRIERKINDLINLTDDANEELLPNVAKISTEINEINYKLEKMQISNYIKNISLNVEKILINTNTLDRIPKIILEGQERIINDIHSKFDEIDRKMLERFNKLFEEFNNNFKRLSETFDTINNVIEKLPSVLEEFIKSADALTQIAIANEKISEDLTTTNRALSSLSDVVRNIKEDTLRITSEIVNIIKTVNKVPDSINRAINILNTAGGSLNEIANEIGLIQDALEKLLDTKLVSDLESYEIKSFMEIVNSINNDLASINLSFSKLNVINKSG